MKTFKSACIGDWGQNKPDVQRGLGSAQLCVYVYMCVCASTSAHASHSYGSWISWIFNPHQLFQALSLAVCVYKYCKHHTYRCSSLYMHIQGGPSTPPPPPRERLCSRAATSLFVAWRTWERYCTCMDTIALKFLPRCCPQSKHGSLFLLPENLRLSLLSLLEGTPSKHRTPLVVWLQRRVRALHEHIPVPASGIMERRHTLSRRIMEPEFKRHFPKDSTSTARHPKVQTRRQLPGQGSTWREQLIWLYSPQSLPPTPSCPPCHNENSVLERALASESGSLKTGILAPTLGSSWKNFKLLASQSHSFIIYQMIGIVTPLLNW